SEVEATKIRGGGGGIAIRHQLVAHLNADDLSRSFGDIGEIIVEREVEVALPRAHVDDARPLGLDRLNQRRKNLDHLVDLPELVLCVIAHLPILAGDAEGMKI